MFSLYGLNDRHRIKIQFANKTTPESLTLKEYQEQTGIRYASSLLFSNENEFKIVQHLCPWTLRYTYWGKENRKMGMAEQKKIINGYILPVKIQWISNEFGYGLFADMPLEKDSYIGEYTGVVRKLTRRHQNYNAYCVHYPTQFFSMNYYMIDALRFGNETRYINHNSSPNTCVRCLLLDNFLHFVFFSVKPILSGEEITCNYGSDYWQHKTPL